MTENKRFTVKQRQGATNYSIRDYYGELPLSEGMYYKSNAEKLCKWLNTQHELLDTLYNENVQLKQRNDRQAKQLDRIYQLIEEKDWRTLNDILDDFKQCEEQLQREWKCYE